MIYFNKWASLALFLPGLLIQSSYAADYGRIKDPANMDEKVKSRARCGDVSLDAQECEAGIREGLAKGCITQDEANKLREWGLSPACIAGKYRGWCACGCFDPATMISVFGSLGAAKAVEIAENPGDYVLEHLEDSSEVGSFSVGLAAIRFSTSGKEAKPLVVIETEDGRTLKVTTKHAIMTAHGEMIKAEKVTPDTLLLDQLGYPVAIKSLRSEVFKGNVVNFRVNVEKPVEHVIFAEHLAVGDQAWQSTLEDLQNQVLIREN